MKADDLIGTWRLRTWKNVAIDSSSVDALGEHPLGFIFYNHEGYMSVEIIAAHRSSYQDADVFGGTSGECSEAISTDLSYSPRLQERCHPCGQYTRGLGCMTNAT